MTHTVWLSNVLSQESASRVEGGVSGLVGLADWMAVAFLSCCSLARQGTSKGGKLGHTTFVILHCSEDWVSSFGIV